MQAVILAAGRGKRLRPLTDNCQKSMLKIGNKPLLQILLEELKKVGVRECFIVVHYFQEQVKDFFGKEFQGMKLHYIFQPHMNGTGGGLKLADEKISDKNFLFFYGDIFFEFKDLKKVVEATGADCVMAGKETETPWMFGVMKTNGEFLEEIVEKPEKGSEPSNLMNAGIFKFNKKIFEELRKIQPRSHGEIYLTDAVNLLAQKGKVKYIKMTGYWNDIGSKEALDEVRKKFG